MLTYSALSQLPAIKSIFPNVYLPLDEDASTEVDLIALSKHCLYVIENKNYGGIIYGEFEHSSWTEYVGGGAYSFYNPVRQNQAHIRGIRRLFPGLSREQIVPVVVFANQCILRTEEFSFVIRQEDLPRFIARQERRSRYRFTRREFTALSKELKCHTRQSPQVERRHKNYVKSRIRESRP